MTEPLTESAAPRPVASWEGRVVDGRYRVLEKLGEGGMGTVYVAEHLTLHKQVALKTILPQYARDGDVSARFEREAMATGRLDHPHVASAMDYGSLPDGGAYLVMQLVRGRSVEEILLAEGGMDWVRVCAICAQVADALAAAHGAGIVHRDLKPENVMIEPRDDGSELALVLDFGIAQITGEAEIGGTMNASSNRKAITRVGSVVGTPGYMSPEQALGEKVDYRADLYALGVLIWEMVTGRSLFDSDDITEIVTLQIGKAKTPRLIEHDNAVPDELQELVDHLLQRQPASRPESAAVAREALRALAVRAATETGRMSLSRLTPIGGIRSVDSDGLPVPKVDLKEPKGRNRTLALAAAAIAVTGAITAALLLRPDAPASADPREDPELIRQIYERSRQDNLEDQLERNRDVLLHDHEKSLRRQAALFIIDYEPADQVENYLRAVADLELASNCAEYREALTAIEELGDARARASVQRMEDAPRIRRRRRRVHAYACVRRQIQSILNSFPEMPEEGSEALEGDDMPDPAPDVPTAP
ncbi:MAG: serine/threonine-protein kinase [Myxococcota bacterium]